MELCDISIIKQSDHSVVETHSIPITYKKGNQKIEKSVQKFMDKIKPYSNAEKNFYVLNDLDLINLYLSSESERDIYHSMKFIPEIRKITNGKNVSIEFNGGDGGAFHYKIGVHAGGTAIIEHNELSYGLVDCVSIAMDNVIYIPTSTNSTKDDYIEAIKQRLKKAFPKRKIEGTYGGT